ncbi:MAG: transporter [Deferribacteraceae bacterium]|jgi:hypothetical protein|nr:transporter [Deferribacteraceae bacterium]
MKRLLAFLLIVIIASVQSAMAAEQPIRFGPFDSGWYPDDTYAVYLSGAHKASPTVDMNMGVFILAAVQEVDKVPIYAHLMLSTADIEVEGVGRTSGAGDMQFVLMPRILFWGSGHLNLGVGVEAPTGSYNKNSYLNIGANRWAFSPRLAVAQGVGRFYFELWGGYDFYTDNKDYLYYTAKTDLEKDGDAFAELHISFKVEDDGNSIITLSLGGIWGGEESAETFGAAHKVRDKMADYAAKATLKTDITNTFSIFISYTYDLYVENGEKGYTGAVKLAKLF